MLGPTKIRELLSFILAIGLVVTAFLIDSADLFSIGLAIAALSVAIYLILDSDLSALVVFPLLAITVFGSIFLDHFNRNRILDAELAKNFGVLEPAQEETPPFGFCEALKRLPIIPGPQVLYVLLGPNVVMVTVFPFTILEMDGVPVFGIDRESSGHVTIRTLKLMDDRKDSIAVFDQKGFWVKPDLKREHPDKSTLVIYDHLGETALRVHFLNPKVLRIEGEFWNKNGLKWTITHNQEASPNGSKSWNICLVDMWQKATAKTTTYGAPDHAY